MSNDFSKEELANSKRIYKSATPKYTLDWYIKWIASGILLAAFSVRGIPEYVVYDQIFSLLGLIGWLTVSILWKDRALIILNSAGILLVLRNLLANLSWESY